MMIAGAEEQLQRFSQVCFRKKMAREYIPRQAVIFLPIIADGNAKRPGGKIFPPGHHYCITS